MLSLASELESTGSLRRSEQPRLLLEMLLLRLAYLDRTVSLEDLIRGLGGASAGRPAGLDRPVMSTPVASPGSGLVGAPEDTPEVEVLPADEGLPAQADSPPTGAAPVAEGIEASWQAVLRAGTLPPGLSVSLRAASVEEVGSGKLRLSLPPGPALERLQSEAALRRSVADAVMKALGRSVELEITEHEAREVGLEAVREGRLRDLVAQEPGLERAVEELDLELLD